jgi:dienelactone hydrolase
LMSLRERPGVDPDRIAIYGVSRGGEASLLVATTYPDLVSRVVALVPSTFVQPADVNRHVSAWTLRGHPVPFGVTERIPVEDIPGPVFAVGAGADFSWPSDRFANDVRQQRPDRDDDVVLIYDTANHAVGIGMPYFPLGHEGGVPEADARADLWPKLVEFLGGH